LGHLSPPSHRFPGKVGSDLSSYTSFPRFSWIRSLLLLGTISACKRPDHCPFQFSPVVKSIKRR
jgi:hypothetical protein